MGTLYFVLIFRAICTYLSESSGWVWYSFSACSNSMSILSFAIWICSVGFFRVLLFLNFFSVYVINESVEIKILIKFCCKSLMI